MDIRESNRTRRPNDVGTPVEPMQMTSQNSSGRSVVRAFLGLPLLVLTAMIAVTVWNERPSLAAGPRVELHASRGKHVTALVFGAGSGIHFMHLSDGPTTVRADLARGPLRIVAFHTIQLSASDVGDPSVVRLTARGPLVQLRRTKDGIFVRTGL